MIKTKYTEKLGQKRKKKRKLTFQFLFLLFSPQLLSFSLFCYFHCSGITRKYTYNMYLTVCVFLFLKVNNLSNYNQTVKNPSIIFDNKIFLLFSTDAALPLHAFIKPNVESCPDPHCLHGKRVMRVGAHIEMNPIVQDEPCPIQWHKIIFDFTLIVMGPTVRSFT